MPIDPYSQLAFVEILNIILIAKHIMDVNRYLIARNVNLNSAHCRDISDGRLPMIGSRCGNARTTTLICASHTAYWICRSVCLQQRIKRMMRECSTNIKEYGNDNQGIHREIAIRAFDYLRHEHKTDSALRLAHHLLHYDRISLGIGEVDWEIDMAIQKFGGNPEQDTDIRHISVSR